MKASVGVFKLGSIAACTFLLGVSGCNGKETPSEPNLTAPTATPTATPRGAVPTPTPARFPTATPTHVPTALPTATPTPSAFAVLTWAVRDACLDGRGVQLKFFDETNNLVWPNASQHYVISESGAGTFPLSVRRGAKVCLGGETDPPTNSYWGVGLDNSHACADCCYVVNADVNASTSLTCGSSLTGAGPAVMSMRNR